MRIYLRCTSRWYSAFHAVKGCAPSCRRPRRCCCCCCCRGRCCCGEEDEDARSPATADGVGVGASALARAADAREAPAASTTTAAGLLSAEAAGSTSGHTGAFSLSHERSSPSAETASRSSMPEQGSRNPFQRSVFVPEHVEATKRDEKGEKRRMWRSHLSLARFWILDRFGCPSGGFFLFDRFHLFLNFSVRIFRIRQQPTRGEFQRHHSFSVLLQPRLTPVVLKEFW